MQKLLLSVMMLVLVSAQRDNDSGPEITGGLDYQRGRGLIGDVGVQGDFYKRENDRITGSASVSKVLIGPGHREKPSVRGAIGYKHEDDRGSFGGGVQYQPGLGAIASVGANYDLYRSEKGDARLSLEAEASKGISGPAKDFKPNYGAFLTFKKTF